MTSAVTVTSVSPAQAQINTAVPALAAASMQAPSEPKSGMSPAAKATVPDAPANDQSKPAQLGVQVQHALLGLTVTDSAISPTAPHTAAPPIASPTAYTEFAVSASPDSKASDNESAGNSSGGSTDLGASNAGTPQKNAAKAAGTAGSSAKSARQSRSPWPLRRFR